MTKNAFLKKVGIFSLLASAEIPLVSEHLRTVKLNEGETLFSEGDIGDDLYILREGGVSVGIRLPDGSEHEVVRFRAGDFFGEMSIFDNAPRSATCRALEKTVLYGLSKSEFSRVIAEQPRTALKLMYRMLNVTTQRLRNTSEFVTDMVLWGENARKRAVTDELTGAYNRRFLEDSLGNYIAEAEERGVPLSLVMVDLDYFRQINEHYGNEKGDEAIKATVRIFREHLREKDVVARYGGDEFVIILLEADAAQATGIASTICGEVSRLEVLKGMDGPIKSVSASMGIAAYPEHAPDLKALRAAADAALYKAKENGRNRVECAGAAVQKPIPPATLQEPVMGKSKILSIGEKNRIINNIIGAIATRHHFLILGHFSPDDDCIASMISSALILHLFYKDAMIYIAGQVHDRFRYLLEICRYNSIRLLGPDSPLPPKIDTIVVCDVPKRSMIGMNPGLEPWLSSPDVVRIEVDHHIGADSEYLGSPGYRLVTEASSASELIGHILLKLRHRKDLLDAYQIVDLFPRNLVLAILTGIIGDSNMGQYLKSSREKRYYRIFSSMFNDLLSRRTVKKSNFFSMDEVHKELQKLSTGEETCFHLMMEPKRFSTSVGYVALSAKDMASFYDTYDDDTIVSTARAVADRLAEESQKLSLVAYYDNPKHSDLIQFRVRRSGQYKSFDLRNLLTRFSIENGGGHEGAIGFRLPADKVSDFEGYIQELIQGIENALPK